MKITQETIDYIVNENKKLKEALNKIAFERKENYYANKDQMITDFKDIAKEALEE